MEQFFLTALGWISFAAFIIISIGTACRMIGDFFSLDKKWGVLFVSKDRKIFNEIKERIEKIELKDHNLQIIADGLEKNITEIYEKLFVTLGISPSEVKLLVKEHLLKKRIDDSISRDPVKELILLLARCTYNFGREVEYGNKTPIKTRYYINTMSITHDPDSGLKMCLLLRQLMIQDGVKQIDFIITPKSGNPILAHKFSRLFKIPVVLLHKSKDESSAVKLSEEEYKKRLQVNYEGFDQLKCLINRDLTKKFMGIALDCNTSGGTQLLNAITSFNDFIFKTEFKDNIEKVSKAFVLFRSEAPPDSKDDIDQKFSSKGIKIIRYFDCNEMIKQQLAEFPSDLIHNNFSEDCDKKVKDVINMLKNKNLFKI